MGDALPFLDLGTGLTVDSISSYTCAVIRETHGLKCWVRSA